MDKPILDYSSPPSRNLKIQIAASLNRIAWALLALSILVISIIYIFMPRKPLEIQASFIVALSEKGAILNWLGVAAGVSTLCLGRIWALGVISLHLIAYFYLPSIGFA
jgi:hypothetical protein